MVALRPLRWILQETTFSHRSSGLLLLLSFASKKKKKKSHWRQMEANIHILTKPSPDLFSNILSASICLQFFSLAPRLPPSHPSRFAPIGSQSRSTGRLLAPSHQNLAKVAHICPHTSRSPAFGLSTDGTAKEKKMGEGCYWTEKRKHFHQKKNYFSRNVS